MKKDKPKVLMELRPCFEGFAGIPQETRLVFRSLNRMDNIDLTGLISHHSRQLARGLSPGLFGFPLKPAEALRRLSSLAISVRFEPALTSSGKLYRYFERRLESQLTRLDAFVRKRIKVYDFDATEFGDFIWQALFSRTLPARDFEMIRTAKYATIRPSWDVMNRVAVQRMRTSVKWYPLPMIDTRKYDIFLSQTPWPSLLAPRTRLVVRYHDAIPIFLPHTISNAPSHQATHAAGLHGCRYRANFVCTSQATRDELVRLYPDLEDKSVVIPDIVSDEYYEEKATPEYLATTIRSHIHPNTEPKFLTVREKEHFYEKYLAPGPHRFLLIVSTLEPRKNHAKLIAAWNYLRNHTMPDLKLIIVGDLGWETVSITASMAAAQQKGELFHLYRIPSGQLRILYQAAAAVVCPSVSEGFDLSGIEAMLCGGVVLASDIPVHREVYAQACEYFDPYSAMDLAKAVERVLSPEMAARRAELVTAGLRHGTKYKSDNIDPLWYELFERIRRGEFKRNRRPRLRTGNFDT